MELTHKLRTSRGGTAALAALAALAAGAAAYTYVDHYRTTVDRGATPATVLVAEKAIPKGLPAANALTAGYIGTKTLRHDELASGAVVDASALRGQVATTEVLPGEQITTAMFGASASGLAARLVGPQRAIAINVDQPHGLAGQLQQGDHVDVLVGFNTVSAGTGLTKPVFKTLLQDVPVLAITKSSSTVGSQQTTNVTLRVTGPEAAQVAYSAENGKVWLVLRPRIGAPAVQPSLVTLQSLLAGVPSVSTGGK